MHYKTGDHVSKYGCMLDFRSWLFENKQMYFDFMKVPVISPEEAKAKKMFGPVYHGTTQDNRAKINDVGFRIPVGGPRHGDVANGYEASDYAMGIPPPVHHLGYGVYFTTTKNRAKMYNYGTVRGLTPYYIDAPRMETINWGAPNTMMKWWLKNGYDMKPIYRFGKPIGRDGDVDQQRIEATKKLTAQLSSMYDAVWYKGKGMGSMLDGDQVVVFDPNRVYRVDDTLSAGHDIGNGLNIKPGMRILVKGTKVTTRIKQWRPYPQQKVILDPWDRLLGKSQYYLEVQLDRKAKENIRQIWDKAVYDEIFKDRSKKWFKEYKSRFASNDNPNATDESTTERIVNYYFNSLDYNFPSNLVDRTVQPRERIK